MTDSESDEGLPLQRWLSAAGLGSKNQVRLLITKGRVTLDGEVVRRFAEPVLASSSIRVDGEPLKEPEPRVVLLMNKPKKHVTGLRDPEGRPALLQYLPPDGPRVFPVGRLDFNTEGALLFTNDGSLARRVLHPDFGLPKRYGIKVRGHLAEDDPGLDRMRAGMTVAGVTYLPAEVRIECYRTRATWIHVTIREGKHRELRQMCRACEYQIVKLRRLAIGPIELGDLNPRCVRPLTPEELTALECAVGLG